MKVWLTKYALSKGISEKDAIPHWSKKEWINIAGIVDALVLGIDAFEDRQSAVKKAEEMRVKKIALIKKELAKLESLKFE